MADRLNDELAVRCGDGDGAARRGTTTAGRAVRAFQQGQFAPRGATPEARRRV